MGSIYEDESVIAEFANRGQGYGKPCGPENCRLDVYEWSPGR